MAKITFWRGDARDYREYRVGVSRWTRCITRTKKSPGTDPPQTYTPVVDFSGDDCPLCALESRVAEKDVPRRERRHRAQELADYLRSLPGDQ